MRRTVFYILLDAFPTEGRSSALEGVDETATPPPLACPSSSRRFLYTRTLRFPVVLNLFGIALRIRSGQASIDHRVVVRGTRVHLA